MESDTIARYSHPPAQWSNHEVGKDPPVVNTIGVGQSAAGDGTSEAGVIELGRDGAEARFDVAEAFAEGELGEGEAEKLIAARESPQLVVAVVVTDKR